LEQARIDTAIELRGLRDELVNLNFTKKEKELNVEQNKYEPQSVIQQTQLDLERTERDYKQLLQKYELKQQQSVAKIQEINTLLKQNQSQMNRLNELSDEFTINAPKSGMVIYARSWRGKKEPGSRVSAWDPVVAELPDLTDMISKTYVNEVDISKVQVGQEVGIKVDAFPDNSYGGQVIQVANIGEQLDGYDAKVFEVTVQLNEVDSILRPAMTTSNEILTHDFQEVLYVPLECIHSDSLTYVFLNEDGKLKKQEIITGLSNDNEIVVDYGLEAGQEIFLSLPDAAEDTPIAIIPDHIKADVIRKQQEEANARRAKAMAQKKTVDKVDLPSTSNSGSDVIVIYE
ncbi:MAG: efflux RND transporter periplasmic adaptor subunit, partial [Bacteroidota bacterium]